MGRGSGSWNSFSLLLYSFILATLGLHCFAQAVSCCSERDLLFVAVQTFLVAVASLVVKYRLSGAWAP